MIVLGDPPVLGVLCAVTALCHIMVISAHSHPPAHKRHSPLSGYMAAYNEASGEYQVEQPLMHNNKGLGSTQGVMEYDGTLGVSHIYEMPPGVSETNKEKYVNSQEVVENNEANTKSAKPEINKIETKTRSKPHSGESTETLASTLPSTTRTTATTLTSATRTTTPSSRAASAWVSGSFGDQRDQEDLNNPHSAQNKKYPQEMVISSGSMGTTSRVLSSEYNIGINDLFMKSDNSSSDPENLYNTETKTQSFKDDNKRTVHNSLLNITKTNINGITTRNSHNNVHVIQDEKHVNINVFNKFTKMSMSKKSKRSSGDFYDSKISKNLKLTQTLLIPSFDPKERQEISNGFSFAGSGSTRTSEMKDIATFVGEDVQSDTADEGPSHPEDANYLSPSGPTWGNLYNERSPFDSFGDQMDTLPDQDAPDREFLPPGFVPRPTEEDGFAPWPTEEDGCHCWNTHDGGGRQEVECKCQGDHIHHLTQHNISRHVNRLTLTKVGLERLRRQDLANYSQTLQEIILQDVKQLEEIESGTFTNLPKLQTIYILHTPQLKHLQPDLFNVSLPSLKILRIVNTGLVDVPALSQLDTNTNHILHMVDLENNQIRVIKSGSIKVHAVQLLLSYNALEYVEQWAFNGSEIGTLSMKGNKQLTALHDLAFAGLKSLRTLDLSETSITHLPTRGIEGLEELRLRETYSLKVFPSVYTFKSINKAELTYHYHCCAFRFPEIHDPNKYKEYMEFSKRMENHDCSENNTAAPVPPNGVWGQRRRRSSYPQKLRDDSKITNIYRMQKHKVISNLKNKRDVENKSDTNVESNYLYYRNGAPPSSSQNSTIKGSQDIGFKEYTDHHSNFHGRAQPGFEDGFMGPEQGIHGGSGGLYDDKGFGNSILENSGPYVEFDGYNDIPDGTFGGVDIGIGGSDGEFGHLDGGFGTLGPPKSVDGSEVDHVNPSWKWNTPIPPSPTIVVNCGKLSKKYYLVHCIPEPDAFNPCEDIMGNIGLRIAVWVVVFLAVLGNLSVMVVLMSTKFKMSVSKFLMCNLAIADLCMGLYLLMIAAMDLHTIGEYFNYAIDWQNGPGCKVAGFLTVFASELSILTLTVITLERWYTITYAIHLNKRLRLKAASRVMVLAWAYAITMATLPLMGVSGYSKTSICLPMETHDVADIAYLLILLITNGLAFILICVCYAKMYCSIAGNNLAANTSDTTVAKRMALLVFTDFACWAPIAFFGLTAVSGYPLINVTHAKFLLVFFYPLNSCANPYLYAILTKQYRRDLFILLARYGFCTKRAVKYKGAYSSNNTLMNHNIVMGSAKGTGSGGVSRRISTLTQVTCVNEPRNTNKPKASSMESLDVPRLRSISTELAPPGSEITVRMVDRRVSDVGRRLKPVAETQGFTGSPHPIKNCQARMSFTPEQEALLLKYASDRNLSSNIPKVRHKSDPGLDDIAAYAQVCTTEKLTAPSPDRAVTPVSPHHGEGLTLCTYTPTRSNMFITPTSQPDDSGIPLQTYTNSTSNMVTTSISPPLEEGLPLHTYTATTSNTDTAPPSPHQHPTGQRESVT